jgi:hypothetical protein
MISLAYPRLTNEVLQLQCRSSPAVNIIEIRTVMLSPLPASQDNVWLNRVFLLSVMMGWICYTVYFK